ncbi:MAG: NAD(+)/NADH kinase [Alphaproteobacteria bacterium]|nr:NAD(+)/NADH kinase [Alphaproteobacteria bacterium]
MSQFKTLALFIKPGTSLMHAVFDEIKTCAAEKEINVVVCAPEEELLEDAPFPRKETAHLTDHETLAVVLGGDGTFLNASRLLYGKNIPILGINLGHLGFLTDVPAEHTYKKICNVLSGEFKIDNRPYFTARIGDTVLPFINDAVLNRMPHHKMLSVDVKVDGEHVTERRADGIIIATPTGSTAYSLSTGGPIVHPGVDALLLTPISPHTLTFRPVILPANAPVKLTLKTPEGLLSLDGQTSLELKETDSISIEKSSHMIKIIHSNRMSYFDLLRTKLHWDN